MSSGGAQWSVKLTVSSKGENTELDIEKRTIRVCRCASCVKRCTQIQKRKNCDSGRDRQGDESGRLCLGFISEPYICLACSKAKTELQKDGVRQTDTNQSDITLK